MNFWQYIATNYTEILALLLEHIKLTAISVGLAVLIGVPLGIFISYMSKASKIVLSIANVIQAIPSMALLGFMIPFLGIGAIPAVTAVVLYSLLPIIKNTYTGLESINSQTLEAAKGIGLTRFQILTKVQIPLALPVIMTGVRVASVTAVGLMTMAAFIGAGGLGNLVFSGIRTVNNNQILAGAIPACLLALFVDFLLGMIEKLVTPISLQKGNAARKKKKRLVQKITLGVTAVAIIVIFVITSIGGGAAGARTITIGSKDYTDQLVLGNLVSEMIEDRTDIQVNRKMNLGGTQVCFSALQSGDIDMYVEYSGTAYSDILQHSPINDVDAVYNTVKTEFKEKYNIEVLSQMKCNNTYILAVKPETAEKYGDEQVHIWRRSYDISPPDLDPKDPNSAHNDRRYANIPSDVIPNAENLKLTLERALPFWEDQIAPAMLSGKRVLVVAHGNSLRALAKHIIGISDAEIMDFEIPTGQPLVLKLDDKLNYVEHYYL